MNQPKLSIIIPIYNEEKRFLEGFEHFFNYLKKQKYGWEIIFVNDGSTDSTLSMAKSAQGKSAHIKIINYVQNRGKGFAIKQGMQLAAGKYVLFSDMDHSVDIKTVNRLLEIISEDYPVVIGSRRVKGSKFIKKQKFPRETLGRIFTLLTRLLIDFKIKDATCGFKLFENKTAKRIFPKLTLYRWVFDAEMLFLCKKYKINYIQAPVEWLDAEGSKVSLRKDVLTSFFGLIKIRLNNLNGDYD